MIGQQVPLVQGYHTDPEKGQVPDITYRPAGFQLKVQADLPKAAGPIELDIDVSLSEVKHVQPPPDPATGMPPVGTPVLEERKAKTHVKVEDGKTAMLVLQPAQAGKVAVLFLTPRAGRKEG